MASEEDIAKYAQQVNKAEQEIARLHKELESLSNPANLLKEGYASPELEQLRAENQKYQFQKTHLKKNLENEKKRVRDCALDVRGIIEDIFSFAIHAAFPELPNPIILVVPSAKFADYQCNSAMSIGQQVKKNPREVAQAIVNQLPDTVFFEKIEIAGPGFINVFLKKEFVSKEITFLLTNGVKPPRQQKKRVVIDFSSPNIAKEMHVGHLRSTIIGESLSRLLEWVGHDVLRLNHLGDWGTQFGMLIAHLMDKFPNLLEERPPLEDLQTFYKESKARFDSDEEFKKRAYECVIKLQAKEPFYYQAWKIIYDISMEVNNQLYQRLSVTLQDRGESFYQDRMVKIVQELEDLGELEVDEGGRKIMRVPPFDVPLMVVKSDGGFTYDTSDIATIRNRLQEEHGEWLIYVVDSGQSLHLETIFATADKLGWVEKGKHRIDHVNFGVVLGEDKFKDGTGDPTGFKNFLRENDLPVWTFVRYVGNRIHVVFHLAGLLLSSIGKNYRVSLRNSARQVPLVQTCVQQLKSWVQDSSCLQQLSTGAFGNHLSPNDDSVLSALGEYDDGDDLIKQEALAAALTGSLSILERQLSPFLENGELAEQYGLRKNIRLSR